MEDARKAAASALKENFGVRQGEKVLVVTDEPLREIGLFFYREAAEMGAEAIYMEMLPRENHGVEPPEAVAAAMKNADVVIMPTSMSLTHTQARKNAIAGGARGATLPGITMDIMTRTLAGGGDEIAQRSEEYADLLTSGSQVLITTPAGTYLTFSIEGRTGIADTGLLREPGSFSNLPSGEAYVAPVEGTANGTLVIDGSMSAIGLLEEPLVIEVKDGFATEIKGGKQAQELQRLLDRYGKEARNIAELGIGTNDLAQLTGNALEDEKILGTVHVALGDNSTFGGTVEAPSHLDGILLKPTLVLDGDVLIDDGESGR